MVFKKTFLSLVLITLTLQATERKEPSLLLEYERELKKTNETAKTDENPFIKSTLAPITVIKPSPATVPVIKTATATNENALPILKNDKTDTDTIGHDEKPFLKVAKPSLSPAFCPSDKDSAASKQDVSTTIADNLKSVKDKVIARAKTFLGTPYGFGHEGEQTDCSGFTQQVFLPLGISLPRSAAEQAQLGSKVDPNDLQVGDLLFYRTYKSDPSHVAIYAGNGQIIHASFSAKKVQYDSIDKEYYKQRFLYAKRLALNEQQN